jgi:hypothetical protein
VSGGGQLLPQGYILNIFLYKIPHDVTNKRLIVVEVAGMEKGQIGANRLADFLRQLQLKFS